MAIKEKMIETAITETRMKKHDFTEAEQISFSKDMAQAANKKKEAEDRLKSVQSSIKSEINLQDATINSFAEKIRSGYEMRPVDCRVFYDNEHKTVVYRDIVTDDIVDDRPMSQQEQAKLL
jgi:hypothetical protein